MGTKGKVIKCKAAVAWEAGKPLCIEEVEVAPPKAHEVRVQIIATAVCHSDHHPIDPKAEETFLPVILGHEGAGIVESVGPGVTGFKPGDKVIPLYTPQCKKCKLCLSPLTNLCEKITLAKGPAFRQELMEDNTSRFTCKGKPIYHFFGISTFSQYTVVSDKNLAKIDDDANLERVCLLGCGFSTGYGAALNTAKVKWSVTRLCQIEVTRRQRDKPERGIFKPWLCGLLPLIVHIRAGIRVLLFYLLSVFSLTFQRAALDCVRVGWGSCTLIGVAMGDKGLTISPLELIMGRTINGSSFGGWKSVDSVPKLVADYKNKKFDLDALVTHTLPFDKINEAFDLLHQGKR
ncbi:all-trans-retinol dehydrogenase [NAD(+)] ADH4-like [Equus quagga]|uniref:all-trans-retinol dehydrogenase [NAD(+)] ADH4-like n=1 Tax=Equus quagga TaxID=89248 RepID=UPI001EE390B5|nr:all-trans-retinol dehydrogenase [NAD(+)] ADH4-like [Equus quagga]